MYSRGPEQKTRAGIVSIERQMVQKSQKHSQSVNQAFEDLSKLMHSAKEMVELAKNLAQEISAKRGAISDDETVQLKSYLLSLGVDDPVTKEGAKSSYFDCLAEEVVEILKQPIKLISPSDMLNACQLLEPSKFSLHLITFSSGVMVLVSDDYDAVRIEEDTVNLVKHNNGLSAVELSAAVHLPVILSRERLLLLEEKGLLCRDESVEGLRFFFNKFLHE